MPKSRLAGCSVSDCYLEREPGCCCRGTWVIWLPAICHTPLEDTGRSMWGLEAGVSTGCGSVVLSSSQVVSHLLLGGGLDLAQV